MTEQWQKNVEARLFHAEREIANQKRQLAARKNPTGQQKSDWDSIRKPAPLANWQWIGLGLVGAAILYAITRPSTANATVVPPATDRHTTVTSHNGVTVRTDPDPDPPVVTVAQGAPPMPPPNAGPDAPRPVASDALVSRLRSSEQARKVFALQALFWAWGHYNWNFGYSNTVPDGVISPGGPTEARIRNINFLAHDPQPVSGDFTNMTMAKAVAVLGTLQPNANYLLPMKLPRDVIDAVNRSINGMSVSIELQAVPA